MPFSAQRRTAGGDGLFLQTVPVKGLYLDAAVLSVPIKGPRGCYTVFCKEVNCKSEGNVLGIENEEKGDAHFCK